MIAIDTDVFAIYHIFHKDPRIQKGLRLGDAVILWTLETNENIDSFITWNTTHFKEKTPIKILTPSELL